MRSTARARVLVCVCVLETLTKRRPNRELGCCAIKRLLQSIHIYHFMLYILIHVSVGLSHRQGTADTREDACMETKIYMVAKMYK